MAEMESYRYTGSNPRVLFHKMRLPGELVECTEAQAAQVNDETPGLLVRGAGPPDPGSAPVEPAPSEPDEPEAELRRIVGRLESEPEEEEDADPPDPGEMTVEEIKALDLTPEQWSELLDLEREGKARVTVIDYAEQMASEEPA